MIQTVCIFLVLGEKYVSVLLQGALSILNERTFFLLGYLVIMSLQMSKPMHCFLLESYLVKTDRKINLMLLVAVDYLVQA